MAKLLGTCTLVTPFLCHVRVKQLSVGAMLTCCVVCSRRQAVVRAAAGGARHQPLLQRHTRVAREDVHYTRGPLALCKSPLHAPTWRHVIAVVAYHAKLRNMQHDVIATSLRLLIKTWYDGSRLLVQEPHGYSE